MIVSIVLGITGAKKAQKRLPLNMQKTDGSKCRHKGQKGKSTILKVPINDTVSKEKDTQRPM